MSKCRPIILAEGPQYCVSQCPECKRFGLHYHNLMIGFAAKDFKRFTKQFLRIQFDDHIMIFPDHTERIIIKTPHPDIQLNLTRDEFAEFYDFLQQAQLILEAKSLI